jgi:NAD(P)-dependent dehydrogenase (short-subunit alcohol dehydrogenase family)
VKKLKGKVAVVTGASSGIGRSTARLFADTGAQVVAGARRKAVLDELAGEHPGAIVPVAVDTTDPDQVEALAAEAVGRHGRIDIWINNAGVVLISRFLDAPLRDVEQVFQTNLMGYVYGMRAALARFEKQGAGIVINNASILGRVSAPYLSIYNASKFAIRGITESVAQEWMDHKKIHLCLVEPGPIDTPIWQHGANYTGRNVRALEPASKADEVARAFLAQATAPQPEVVVGKAGSAEVALRRVAPRLGSKLMKRYIEKMLFEREPAEDTSGNLYEPGTYTTESGGWKANGTGARKVVAGAGIAAAAWALLRKEK